MNMFIILRRDAWADVRELEIAAGLSSRVGTRDLPDRIRWIRSYITRGASGRLGLVCVFQGRDLESVQEHARLAGLPCDEILPVFDTVVLNDDPTPGLNL